MSVIIKIIHKYINKLCLIFVTVFLVYSTNAQQWQWVSSAGGSKSDKGLDIDLDKYGNAYVSGYYNSPTSASDVSFGTIYAPTDFGKEGFIAKIDSNGTWQWMRYAFGGWDERALGMCVDKINDYIYVTGTSWYYTEFGSCPIASPSGGGGSDNIFVTKFDLSGNCQWHIAAGSGADDHGYDLITDKAGNIYVTGFVSDKYMSGTEVATFGPFSVAIPYADTLGFVAKLSPSGIWQWVKTFHGTDGERDNRIAIDSSNNIYITGGFKGTQTFGSFTKTSIGGYDVFVIKYDDAGNLIWVETAGSLLSDRGNSLIVDPYQDIYVTGEFRDHIVFGTDSLNNYGGPSGRDIFVAKIKNNGSWVWAKKAGSNGGSDRGNRIVSGNDETLYLTGQFKGNAKFGSADTLNSGFDSIQIFVAAIDTSGKWQWAIQAGSDVEDRGTGIAIDDSCNIYVTGFYENTANFGTISTTAIGRKDIFVGRIPNACLPTLPPTPEPVPEEPIECTYTIPNIFSPNNDNLNDIFQIYGNCIDQINFGIYNRWGTKICVLTDPLQTWNGKTNKGDNASEGVYYYAGEITFVDGSKITLKGFITLVR